LGRDFHPIYFTANNGREPLFFYWAALFLKTLQAAPFSLNVAAAFAGVLTPPAVYFCISQVLRKAEGPFASRRIGLFAAASCAVLFFHVLFSRLGLRTITLPLFECLAFGFLWQAVRLRSLWRYLLGGILLGLCLYTYTSARLLIAGLAVYAVYRLLFARKDIDWRGWLAAGLTFVLASLPLGLYALKNQAEFFQRSGTIAVTDRQHVIASAIAILKMFFVHGSDMPFQNIPGMPVFDVLMGVAFAAGLLLLIPRLRQSAYVFLVIWLLSIIPASLFSPDAPYYLRLTGLIPPLVAIPALALAELPRLIRQVQPRWAYAPSAALVLASGAITGWHYFGVWAPSRDTFYALMQDKVDGSAYLRQLAGSGAHVFLARLYAQDWTYIWLTRGTPMQDFQATDCTVLPPRGTDAVYVFPHFDADQPPALDHGLPVPPTIEHVANSRGEPNLLVLREPSSALPAPGAPLQANFGGQLGLVHVDGLPSGSVRPGSTVTVTLTWQALAQMTADYVIFVHADDTANNRRIQRDSMPCSTSFLTSWWIPGEEVIDRYPLAIPADAPDGTYKVTVGAYSLPDVHNLTLAGSGTTELNAGAIRVAR
jgi:hypothetical protein